MPNVPPRIAHAALFSFAVPTSCRTVGRAGPSPSALDGRRGPYPIRYADSSCGSTSEAAARNEAST